MANDGDIQPVVEERPPANDTGDPALAAVADHAPAAEEVGDPNPALASNPALGETVLLPDSPVLPDLPILYNLGSIPKTLAQQHRALEEAFDRTSQQLRSLAADNAEENARGELAFRRFADTIAGRTERVERELQSIQQKLLDIEKGIDTRQAYIESHLDRLYQAQENGQKVAIQDTKQQVRDLHGSLSARIHELEQRYTYLERQFKVTPSPGANKQLADAQARAGFEASYKTQHTGATPGARGSPMPPLAPKTPLADGAGIGDPKIAEGDPTGAATGARRELFSSQKSPAAEELRRLRDQREQADKAYHDAVQRTLQLGTHYGEEDGAPSSVPAYDPAKSQATTGAGAGLQLVPSSLVAGTQARSGLAYSARSGDGADDTAANNAQRYCRESSKRPAQFGAVGVDALSLRRYQYELRDFIGGYLRKMPDEVVVQFTRSQFIGELQTAIAHLPDDTPVDAIWATLYAFHPVRGDTFPQLLQMAAQAITLAPATTPDEAIRNFDRYIDEYGKLNRLATPITEAERLPSSALILPRPEELVRPFLQGIKRVSILGHLLGSALSQDLGGPPRSLTAVITKAHMMARENPETLLMPTTLVPNAPKNRLHNIDSRGLSPAEITATAFSAPSVNTEDAMQYGGVFAAMMPPPSQASSPASSNRGQSAPRIPRPNEVPADPKARCIICWARKPHLPKAGLGHTAPWCGKTLGPWNPNNPAACDPGPADPIRILKAAQCAADLYASEQENYRRQRESRGNAARTPPRPQTFRMIDSVSGDDLVFYDEEEECDETASLNC